MSKKQKKAEAEAFLDAVGKAMKAAAKEARRVARIHGTKVWVVKDGKIVYSHNGYLPGDENELETKLKSL